MKHRSLFLLGLLGCLCLPFSSCASPEAVTLNIDYALSGRDSLMSKLKDKFPSYRFNFDIYKGRNPDGYILQRLEKEDTSDLLFAPSVPTSSLQKEKLLDLSTYAFASRFDTTSWNDYKIDGKIYLLPGPLNVRFLAYNKTLFEERGWTIPKNFDDLVSLCSTIHSSDSSLIPLSLSGANISTDLFLLLILAQCKNLFSSGGNDWLAPYVAGTGSCGDGLTEAVKMVQRLITAKAFSLEDRDHWYGDAYTGFAKNRKAAMLLVWNGQNDLDSLISSNRSDEFGVLPFLGSQETNRVLGIESAFSFGISKRLSAKGQEKKLEAALQVLDYLSSKEGMTASEGGATTGYFPLSGVNNETASPFFQKVFSLGQTSSQSRPLISSFSDVAFEAGTALKEALFSFGNISSLPSQIDAWHKTALQEDATGFYGDFAGDFSKEETAQLMANVLQNSAYGDVSVVSLGGVKNGLANEFGSAWGKLYQGRVRASEINIPVPKDGSILTVNLTGEQLYDLLRRGKKMISSDKSQTACFPLYCAGLTSSGEGSSFSSLSCGSAPLERNKTYRVAYVGLASLATSLKEVFAAYPSSSLSSSSSLPYVENDTRIAFLTYYSGYLHEHPGLVASTPFTLTQLA
jgi:raffinose/stachyose/melibiose transport system substrate-binding protein